MEIRKYENFHLEDIINLYQSVGWTNYLERIGILEEAYANSLCVLGAYDDDRLIGIIRAVGDGQTIVFVQDIIVLPEYQRRIRNLLTGLFVHSLKTKIHIICF